MYHISVFSFSKEVILSLWISQISLGSKGARRYASQISSCSDWIHCFIGILQLALVRTHSLLNLVSYTWWAYAPSIYFSAYYIVKYHINFFLLIILFYLFVQTYWLQSTSRHPGRHLVLRSNEHPRRQSQHVVTPLK